MMSVNLSKIEIILNTYGFYGNHSAYQTISKKICFSANNKTFKEFKQIKCHKENGNQLYYSQPSWFNPFHLSVPIYHALLPHLTFTGKNVEPLWVNKAGHALVAWHNNNGNKILLLGLDVEEEIIRHRQGDPSKVESVKNKGGFGFDFERPNYLFNDQILSKYRTLPWADHLGFFLAEMLSRLSGYPLVEPLPEGAKGLVILTGDDDQAYLEKYNEQLQIVGNTPITYFLVPQTRHTEQTLAKLPAHVEFGLHVDALEQPEEYDRLCKKQAEKIRWLTKKSIRTLRNHGFLNRGYLGHLKAWEDNGIQLDVNYSGMDGMALNGSFLPMRMQRPDKTWSSHYSLLTQFGDGMLYFGKLTERQGAKLIRQLAKQISRSYPGVLVVNFHPQNISDTKKLHKEVIALGYKQGWLALGLDSYLDWLEILENIGIKKQENVFLLTSPKSVKGLVLKFPTKNGWRKVKLPQWSGQLEVS